MDRPARSSVSNLIGTDRLVCLICRGTPANLRALRTAETIAVHGPTWRDYSTHGEHNPPTNSLDAARSGASDYFRNRNASNTGDSEAPHPPHRDVL